MQSLLSITQGRDSPTRGELWVCGSLAGSINQSLQNDSAQQDTASHFSFWQDKAEHFLFERMISLICLVS